MGNRVMFLLIAVAQALELRNAIQRSDELPNRVLLRGEGLGATCANIIQAAPVRVSHAQAIVCQRWDF